MANQGGCDIAAGWASAVELSPPEGTKREREKANASSCLQDWTLADVDVFTWWPITEDAKMMRDGGVSSNEREV